MQNRYTEHIVLKTEHVDLAERWTMSAILIAMQAAADNHADMLGAAKEHVAARGMYWVIARSRVDMQRYPKYNDAVSVTTWPGEPDRVSFPRYFQFHDATGALLGAATVKYMLLDMHSHAIIPPAKADIYPDDFMICPDTNAQPEKIRFREATRETVYRKPAYSDIDLNRHMNNTRYAQWVCDLFSTADFEQRAFQTFQINYVSDGVEGHAIALDVQDNREQGAFVARGVDTHTQKTVFECTGSWRDIS